MFEKTREKEDAEREADENQISINDLENENTEENIEQNGDVTSEENAKAVTEETESAASEVEDEPSAEDDIVDID